MATLEDIRISQEMQDRGIRLEFKNVHERMDQLSELMDQRFDEVDQRFNEVEQRFNDVDKRFDVVDKRFDAVDRRFEVVDRQFDVMNGQITQLSNKFHTLQGQVSTLQGQVGTLQGQVSTLQGKFGTLESRLCNSEIRAINGRAICSWQRIHPVMRATKQLDGTHTTATPEKFPDRVIKFWRLQNKRGLPTLISLLQFYRLSVHRTPTMDFDDSEDDSSSDTNESSPPEPLEEIVKSNPYRGLETLAEHLGLNFLGIEKRMKIEKSEWEAKKFLESKRQRGNDVEESARPLKRLHEPPAATQYKDGEPLIKLVRGPSGSLHMEGLTPEKPESLSPEQRSEIGWDVRSQPSPGPRLQFSSQEKASHTALTDRSKESPMGSPTQPITESR